MTVDGTVEPGLFELAAEDAPIAGMLKAANNLLSTVTPSEHAKLVHPLTSVERRRWLNPELYLFRHGLRLDEVSAETRTAIFDFLKTTLSEIGYTKLRNCMYMNAFLGTVMAAPLIMNEYSYNFTLFGRAFAHRTVGLAVARPSRRDELSDNRRTDGHDALLLGSRTQRGRPWPTPRSEAVHRRGKPRGGAV